MRSPDRVDDKKNDFSYVFKIQDSVLIQHDSRFKMQHDSRFSLVLPQRFRLQTMIQTETESRLRKMGFREDNGLQRPMKTEIGLGVDGTSTLKKQAAQADTIDQLASLSYKELRDLQTNIEAGKTEGIPRELLG